MKERIGRYAELIVEKGANIQKGQPVMISAPIERADFARILAEKAYKRGATEVIMNWADDELTLLKYENAPMEVFEEYPKWAVDKSKYYFEKDGAVISIHAEDPELLKDVDPKKIAAWNKAAGLATKENRKYTMNDLNSWCVVSAPTKAWAKKVFPELSEAQAVEELWTSILDSARVGEDPIKNWNEHVADMDSHADFLNEKQFRYLHYKNSKGTDLKVELPKNHIWLSAGSKNAKGVEFIANIPTEEVFTMPKKDGAEGVLYSTKPLNYGGNLIDGMRFVFENGKVVEYSAEIGEQYLKDMFGVDENGKHLGEVALVPFDSPISNSNILYYNTLFDENASCHFAFGKAYPTCIEGGTKMNEDELKEAGVNDALIHEDFMVGSEDLSIKGETWDGELFTVFEKGNWA